MLNQVLLYLASVSLVFWGIAHLLPIRSVVGGFVDISIDNKRIIAMEWIIEGASLIFIGVLVASVTYVDHTSLVAKTVFRLSFLMLIALAIISLMTGFKINFAPYRLCPAIFTVSAILIILGVYF